MHLQWQLGFLEHADALSLLRHRFPSKVGGRPVCTPPLSPHTHHLIMSPLLQLATSKAEIPLFWLDTGMVESFGATEPRAAHMHSNWAAFEFLVTGTRFLSDSR